MKKITLSSANSFEKELFAAVVNGSKRDRMVCFLPWEKLPAVNPSVHRTLCKRSHIADTVPAVIHRIDLLSHRTVDSSVDKIYIDTRLSSEFNFLTRWDRERRLARITFSAAFQIESAANQGTTCNRQIK
jgi:hypothetical protein